MGLLKRLGKILSGGPSQADRAMYLYVECNKCGEKLKARVDVWNELSPEYEGNSDEPTSYQCRKVLIGEKCYQPIELRLKFDRNHKLVEKEILGGRYIEKDKQSA